MGYGLVGRTALDPSALVAHKVPLGVDLLRQCGPLLELMPFGALFELVRLRSLVVGHQGGKYLVEHFDSEATGVGDLLAIAEQQAEGDCCDLVDLRVTAYLSTRSMESTRSTSTMPQRFLLKCIFLMRLRASREGKDHSVTNNTTTTPFPVKLANCSLPIMVVNSYQDTCLMMLINSLSNNSTGLSNNPRNIFWYKVSLQVFCSLLYESNRISKNQCGKQVILVEKYNDMSSKDLRNWLLLISVISCPILGLEAISWETSWFRSGCQFLEGGVCSFTLTLRGLLSVPSLFQKTPCSWPLILRPFPPSRKVIGKIRSIDCTPSSAYWCFLHNLLYLMWFPGSYPVF